MAGERVRGHQEKVQRYLLISLFCVLFLLFTPNYSCAVHKMSARPRVLLVATLICGHAVCDGLALPQPRRWSHLVRDRLTEHSALLDRARQLQAVEG